MHCHVKTCAAEAVYSDGAHHPEGYAVPTCADHNKGSDAPIGRVCPLNVRPRLPAAVCNCHAVRRDVRRYAIVDGEVMRLDQVPLRGETITVPVDRFGGLAIEARKPLVVLSLAEFEIALAKHARR